MSRGLPPHTTTMDAETIHQLVANRRDEIRQRVTDALIEAQGQGASGAELKIARKAIVRAFPGIVLPPEPEIQTFKPPDLTPGKEVLEEEEEDSDDPFANITLADISGPTVDQVRERMQSVSMALNTPQGRGNAELLNELVELQSQLNDLQ